MTVVESTARSMTTFVSLFNVLSIPFARVDVTAASCSYSMLVSPWVAFLTAKKPTVARGTRRITDPTRISFVPNFRFLNMISSLRLGIFFTDHREEGDSYGVGDSRYRVCSVTPVVIPWEGGVGENQALHCHIPPLFLPVLIFPASARSRPDPRVLFIGLNLRPASLTN